MTQVSKSRLFHLSYRREKWVLELVGASMGDS